MMPVVGHRDECREASCRISLNTVVDVQHGGGKT